MKRLRINTILQKWTTFIVEPATVVTEVNIWIIIGSILGALLLLIIVVGILWKVSHYNYTKPSRTLEPWKLFYTCVVPALVAHLDASSTGHQEVAVSTPPGRQHSFVEIDHEIFSSVILSLPLIQEGHI